MNCGKCHSPLTYGVPACAVCGTPVAWDQVPAPTSQVMPVVTSAVTQPQPTVIVPPPVTAEVQSVAQQQTLTPSSQAPPQPATAQVQAPQYTQTQATVPNNPYAQPAPALGVQDQQTQYVQPPAILAATEPSATRRVGGVTATGITAIVLGTIQLLISLAAFTDEEVAATSGSGIINASVGMIFIALGIALIKVNKPALLRKLCITFIVLSTAVVVLSFVLGIAGYHYVIALGFGSFTLWKLLRSR